jgi:alpha-beta hydrolase superfamily lysophospholipase
MHILRTRFKKDIVAEFLPPLVKVKKQRVVIFAGGMPGYPDKADFIESFARKGFWVFVPRYRGSWESDGVFLKHSPHFDILDIIEELPKGFVSAFDGKKFKVTPDQIFLIGSSFGGPAAILASQSPQVTKAILLSPVVDWRYPSKAEPLGFLAKFVTEAFGNGYRIDQNGWRKLAKGNFYNPASIVSDIDGAKLLILHSLDDEIVDYRSVTKFSRDTGAQIKIYKSFGHFGASIFRKPAVYKLVRNFMK